MLREWRKLATFDCCFSPNCTAVFTLIKNLYRYWFLFKKKYRLNVILEGMGKLDLVDADLINPASGNRSHLERALFHFRQEHIILLCTRLFHLHLECSLPVPGNMEAMLVLFLPPCPGVWILPPPPTSTASSCICGHWSKPPAGPGPALISFAAREKLVCGQTAHCGAAPAAHQVTN